MDANTAHLRRRLAWVAKEPEPVEVRIAWIRKARADFDEDRDYAYAVFTRDERELIGGAGLHLRQGKDPARSGIGCRRATRAKGWRPKCRQP